MNIGVFGGTFDPVHKAHLEVARVAMQECGLGRVLFMPGASPPHKKGKVHATEQHRVAMLGLALAPYPNYGVCTAELDDRTLRYTVDTMRALRKRMPEDTLFFIIGGDSLLNLERWHNSMDLLLENSFIALYRPEDGVRRQTEQAARLMGDYGTDITLLRWAGMPFSSTDVRQKAAAGEDVSQMTGQEVARYIAEHGLYKGVRGG